MVSSKQCNIIAYLSTFFSLLNCAWSIYLLVLGVLHYDRPIEYADKKHAIVTGQFKLEGFLNDKFLKIAVFLAGVIAFLALNVVLTVIKLIACVLLIIGIKKVNILRLHLILKYCLNRLSTFQRKQAWSTTIQSRTKALF